MNIELWNRQPVGQECIVSSCDAAGALACSLHTNAVVYRAQVARHF